jgi:hypothetical protein
LRAVASAQDDRSLASLFEFAILHHLRNELHCLNGFLNVDILGRIASLAVVIANSHIEAVADLIGAVKCSDIGRTAIDYVAREANAPSAIKGSDNGIIVSEDFSADLDDKFIGVIATIRLDDEVELLQLLKLTSRRTPKPNLLISAEVEGDIIARVPRYMSIDSDTEAIITANLERAGLVLNDAANVSTIIHNRLDDGFDLNGRRGGFAVIVLKPMMQLAILAVIFFVEANGIVVAANVGVRNKADLRIATNAEHIMDALVATVFVAALGTITVLDYVEALASAYLLDEPTKYPLWLATTLNDMLLKTVIERHRLEGFSFECLIFCGLE